MLKELRKLIVGYMSQGISSNISLCHDWASYELKMHITDTCFKESMTDEDTE